ncbi:hypothetical protein HMI56_002119 [Coelomomyces lativittatus]|nr:hypothetical protein HMI56_002119 [Coelomomyces lativittatus]
MDVYLLLDALSQKIFLPNAMIARFMTLADDITKLELPTLTPLCDRIRQNFSIKILTLGPSHPTNPELIPKFFNSFFTHEKEYLLQSSVTSKISDFKSTDPKLNQNELLACFEGIWLQVDTEPDRLVMPNNIAIQETTLDEIHISCAPGILQITQRALIWWGIEREANLVTAVYAPALTLHYSSILRYAFGRVTDATQLPYASHTLHQLPKRDDTLHVRSYFLHAYTSDSAFRFYPIYDDEIARFTSILNHGVGKPGFKEIDMVKYVVAKRLAATRHRLYQTVVSYTPLIEHSADLIKVVRKLTKEGEPQCLYDMERLFHSCRVESEVTKETLHHLRIAWHASPSETVRFKVLSIVDRLLDPSVVHLSDPNFALMHKWLQHLEETVSPYKRYSPLKKKKKRKFES